MADFGGNDGYAAHKFYLKHGIKPLVVDCEPRRIEHARTKYDLSTYETFLEDMRAMRRKSIDWGFCSHTLEHARDPRKALRDMARVIRRGCLFILPIEDAEHADRNTAHAIHADSLKEWRTLIAANGWRVVNARRPIPQECFVVARPQ